MAKGAFNSPSQAHRVGLFVEHYVATLNGAQSAREAGYKGSDKVIGVTVARLLGDDRVQALIETRRKELSARTQITPEKVLQRWWMLATADPNELIEHRRVNCRYCWGEDHGYQWTQGEYDKACDDAIQADKDLPSLGGGTGFRRNALPHYGCPHCLGEGVEEVFAKDTRFLSEAARVLYAGVKVTKEGLQILTNSQDGALLQVTKIIGMMQPEATTTINQTLVNETNTTNITLVSPEQVKADLEGIFRNARSRITSEDPEEDD